VAGIPGKCSAEGQLRHFRQKKKQRNEPEFYKVNISENLSTFRPLAQQKNYRLFEPFSTLKETDNKKAPVSG